MVDFAYWVPQVRSSAGTKLIIMEQKTFMGYVPLLCAVYDVSYALILNFLGKQTCT